MTADVEIRGVTHRFGETVALRSVSLRLAAGDFAVLLGPSGCGKTTLLSVLGGFLTPAAGMVLIGGQDVTAVPPAKRPTTTVFQDYALFPHMTLGANVGFGLRMRGVPRAARDAKAAEMLRLVGLADAFHRRPHELSGGQRQRVALARALAVEPEVLLLDEPLGALDLKLRRQMQDELKEIQRRVGTTFVHVTHDQEEAMAIADRIVVMERGEIRDEGPPERVYLAPRSRFSAAFMGEANFVAGTLEAAREALTVTSPLGRHALPRTALAADTAPGRAVELCFRPEHLRAGDPPTGMLDLGAGTVADISFFGTHHRAHVTLDTLPGQPVAAHLPQSLRPAPGARIRLHLDPATVILLPVGGG
jgi:spermidine/putrescine transport system ATP-binding protein